MSQSVSWNQFTPAQRRRAEALLLVTSLMPSAMTGANQFQIAQWIVTGRVGS